MREKLRQIVDDNTTKKGRIFDIVIQILIFISLIAYTIETLQHNSETTKLILKWIESVCIVIFLIEYFLRIYVAERRLRYIFSFYGMIDFLAILPFFLTKVFDLRSLRAFRIFRIFRAFKLIRYNRALNRFALVAKLIREEVILFLIVTGIFLFLASAGIFYFENEAQPNVFASIFHSAWWAIVTLTTVGYGDVYPITVGGKLFTFFILMLGVGIVTIPAGLVASALTKAREMEEEAMVQDQKGDNEPSERERKKEIEKESENESENE